MRALAMHLLHRLSEEMACDFYGFYRFESSFQVKMTSVKMESFCCFLGIRLTGGQAN